MLSMQSSPRAVISTVCSPSGRGPLEKISSAPPASSQLNVPKSTPSTSTEKDPLPIKQNSAPEKFNFALPDEET